MGFSLCHWLLHATQISRGLPSPQFKRNIKNPIRFTTLLDKSQLLSTFCVCIDIYRDFVVCTVSIYFRSENFNFSFWKGSADSFKSHFCCFIISIIQIFAQNIALLCIKSSAKVANELKFFFFSYCLLYILLLFL